MARSGVTVVDLAPLGPQYSCGSLDALIAAGPDAWNATADAVRAGGLPERDEADLDLVLPWTVGDYADFYASRHHVINMGRLLRPSEDPLPPAWLHLPIGYHGRSGTVVVSGTDIPRPSGILGPGLYGPTERLDVEIELGFIVGVGLPRGRTLTADEAANHIFGMVILNDWSARDVQAFEYRPLGPFLGKSFATSVSPWVMYWPSLERYVVDGPVQDPPPVHYLRQREPRNIDVRLELRINDEVISGTRSADLYWSPAQQLAHLTANGAGFRTGDLFASGTISGPTPGSEGSLMERYAARRWLDDDDVVTIEGWCAEQRIGLVTGKVTKL